MILCIANASGEWQCSYICCCLECTFSLAAICSPPCLNDGLCTNDRTCQCIQYYSGQQCEGESTLMSMSVACVILTLCVHTHTCTECIMKQVTKKLMLYKTILPRWPHAQASKYLCYTKEWPGLRIWSGHGLGSLGCSAGHGVYCKMLYTATNSTCMYASSFLPSSQRGYAQIMTTMWLSWTA